MGVVCYKFVHLLIFTDAVNFVKSILDAINGNIGSSNVDELLRQAETMLEDIKRRDFSVQDNAARVELSKARDGMMRIIVHGCVL